jgi:DNA-binding IscR family transcriptional regulator
MSLVALNNRTATTSELLAKSVNTNPVVIRRIISMLKKDELLTSHAGVAGANLLREPDKITLLDIYNAVKDSDDAMLFDIHKNPNPMCYVGANIRYALSAPLEDAQKALEDRLDSYTLLDVIRPIRDRARLSR